ncbi:hypothetical protein NBRC116601_22640 [Cognatishimia sp. WU-CL00825]|uniref:hypothetical protein n=1 Tax=Cognatishimia sp. WU-CL00825 TaxID=3127658 RepID=UPI003107055C
MRMITAGPLPAKAFLKTLESDPQNYVDCYATRIGKPVSLEELISALFNTLPFRIERHILRVFARQSTADKEVADLAKGTANHFAMWQVLQRNETQVLMRVGPGPIHTWMMVKTDGAGTDLFFGSAVTTRRGKDGKAKGKGVLFWSLHWFHKLYSRVLLGSARRRLL